MNNPTGIGASLSRVDGIAKVTGEARYAAEYPLKDLLHAVSVPSPIAKGRIASIDTTRALAVPGVIDVLTHENRPHTATRNSAYKDELKIPGGPFAALYDDEIKFSGQPIALVVAETFEVARYAAGLLDIEYEQAEHQTDFDQAERDAYLPPKKRSAYQPPKPRGDADAAYRDAPVKHAASYMLAPEHHNPMEMHATTIAWHSDGTITVYDKTQGSQGVQAYLCAIFGWKAKNVRVLNRYVGGGFGSGLRPQHQVYLAALAAKHLERSIRVVMTRAEMFTHVHRPQAIQSTKLGADSTGKLLSITNNAVTSTSRFEDNMENVVNWGLMNYACDNAQADYKVAAIDTYTSGDMRAPGAATGMTLFEIAMDELAYEVGVDPLELRLINYSDVDAMTGRPFTSKALREAYAEGAAAFGWSKRSPETRSMREGSELIGWGMATGVWDALFTNTSASAKLMANGDLEVATASSDIGTGTYTVMTQVASETLGIPGDRITAKLGDSDLPTAPVEGGSWGAASGGAAVQLACNSIGEQLLKAAAKTEGSPFKSLKIKDVVFEHSNLVLKADPTVRQSFAEIMRIADLTVIEAEEKAGPGLGGMIDMLRHARNTHSAVFAEVRVDEELGVVRVTRVVSAIAAGRILNPKTARSQILGGVVMGIGMALHEETLMDTRLGRFMNHSFAEYHIPAHADIADIEVIFVEEKDPNVSPLGVKGVGEIGIVGTAAAIANAIYHATGKRVRSLPITIDKLLD